MDRRRRPRRGRRQDLAPGHPRLLAAVKQAIDEIRAHADDPLLLAHATRILRDRAALEGSEEGFEDYRAGRVTRLTPDLLDEIEQARRLEAAAALAAEAQDLGIY